MPPKREEIVRDAVEAINAGDWDRALAHLSADFEYDLTRTISPLRGVYSRERDARGRRGVPRAVGERDATSPAS